MDYTQNYHLPQWEKSDRLLMDDFNQMCASIDEGISTVKASADRLASQIAGNAGSADAALKRGLFRNAYNRYHAAASLGELPRQLGFFYQKLTSGVCGKTGFENLLAKGSSAVWLANSGKAVDRCDFQSYCTVSSRLSVSSSASTPLVFECTTPGAGYFSEFLFSSAGECSIPQGTNLRFRVTLLNLNTGKKDVDKEITVNYNVEFPIYIWIREKFFFHQAKYRVTIAPVNTNYTGVYACIPYACTVKSAAGSMRKTVEVGETSMDGFVSLVYEDYGSAALQLKWDGKTVAPYTTYSYAGGDGRSVKEIIWRRGGEVPASTTFQIDVSCSAGSDATLYNWGMALI